MRDVLSDLPVLVLPALALTALIVAALALGVLLALAVRLLVAGLYAARRIPATVEPFRDPRPLVACHRPKCGHISWPHDETDEGLRCSNCGQLNPDA
ncbi:hypothetical protein [Streptomyces rubiginosohelvolus]|uniref:Uncharacterized protein n=1 Tax=Streptomyces rubiginosohelvolus TaxID=67362 RepID=A0ABQ3BUH8_9ACTN|nr:hypothetical protein [Streptomyces pluricolorescens]GGZ53001.1 hypothetical protein GCM10010328_29760 [Streptomyces pluricolorescens]